MKKTVMNLAVVSCFAFGISLAQASTHGDADAHADSHGAAHTDYFGKADITGQAQNIKVDAKGVRLPYNMAADMPSVGDHEHGVRAMHGQPNPLFVGPNVAKPKVESSNTWGMVGTNNPSGTTYNRFMSGYGKGYVGR
ncbi:MAG: hypothetical protein K8R50_11275 [Betaproteobacteria bacterium]|nr:hypothetical protein [Betaproteobacteria bacterium]